MMNVKRIKELQEFTDDFNNRLNLAAQRYEENKTDINSNNNLRKSTSKSPRKASPKQFKPKITANLFKPLPSWKPTDGEGGFFGDFKLQKVEHVLDPWEIYRINLLKRSYEKQSNMLEGKNFVCREMGGKEFEHYEKTNKSHSALSTLGNSIIETFIKENKEREQKMRDKDDEIWKFRHSKPSMDLNKWKWSNHIITEFSTAPGDFIVSYKKEPRKKFLISDPYLIPKKEGDYFDKEFKRLG